ncbi:TetR family transcriptional regulator [Seohaeicola saemankumensis]|uniref:TetR family transcriptional regulator n=1 Tax=Seohaeicola saemankumensis TaxID=481181 RepID=A0ABW3TA92_9RHOB
MTEAAEQKKSRRRDPERTRAQLLEAALHEFADHGFHGARVDRITRAVGCNPRLLYHYFGSKEKLYIAALEHIFADIRAQERELDLDRQEPLQAMRRLVEFTFDFFDGNPLFVKLTRNENLLEGRFIAQIAAIRTSSQPLLEAISAIMARGQAQGVFGHRYDPLQIYVTIVALSAHHLNNGHTLSAIFGIDLLSRDWRGARRAHTVDLVLNALTGDESPRG